MTSNVIEYSLKSLCIVIVDCPHATPKWTDSGFVVLRNQNIKGGRLDLSEPSFTDESHFQGRIKRAIPQQGDIVITREAPMGDVCQIPPGLICCLGQRQVLLRPNPAKVHGRFLLYALQSPYVQDQIGWNEGTGSTVSNLRIPVLEALKIPTPSLLAQNEVAETLGAIDDRIKLLGDTNATLEAIAQALFKSWFVDFDPVLAKVNGRVPEGMDEATAALFPDGFEGSKLGEVPKGWGVSTLAEQTLKHGGSVQTGPFGSQLHASDYSEVGTPVAMPKDLAYRRINTSSVARVANEHVSRLARHQLAEGDIVFSRRGDVERHALVMATEVGWLCGTGCLLVRPGKTWKWPAYLSMLLDSSQAKLWLVQHAVGATMPNLNTGILGSIPLVVPPTNILDEFENVAMALEKRRSENLATMETLACLRDRLLPRLIFGQLRLSEVEHQFDAIAA
jgi:type I restriction enzyme S subunit